MMPELKVDAICQGTVIDHIPAGKAFQIIDLLEISPDDPVMIGTNLASKKYGRKDIIKIEHKKLTEEELSSIAIISQTITISIIEDFKAVRKLLVTLPDTLRGILVCPNRHCVTNVESAGTLFAVESRDPLRLRCIYCERVFDSNIKKYIKCTHEHHFNHFSQSQPE